MTKITHYDDHRAARAAAYPDIGDQLDAIWKWIGSQEFAGAAAPMLEQVRAVKERFPKAPNVE